MIVEITMGVLEDLFKSCELGDAQVEVCFSSVMLPLGENNMALLVWNGSQGVDAKNNFRMEKHDDVPWLDDVPRGATLVPFQNRTSVLQAVPWTTCSGSRRYLMASTALHRCI